MGSCRNHVLPRWPTVMPGLWIGVLLFVYFLFGFIGSNPLSGGVLPATTGESNVTRQLVLIGVFACSAPILFCYRLRAIAVLRENVLLVGIYGWLGATTLWSAHPPLTTRRLVADLLVFALLVAAVTIARSWRLIVYPIALAAAVVILLDVAATVLVPSSRLVRSVPWASTPTRIWPASSPSSPCILIGGSLLACTQPAGEGRHRSRAGCGSGVSRPHQIENELGPPRPDGDLLPGALSRNQSLVGRACDGSGGAGERRCLGHCHRRRLRRSGFSRRRTRVRRCDPDPADRTVGRICSRISAQHPLLGSGWGAFWDTGAEINPINAPPQSWVLPATEINTAHSGYLDIWLQAGAVGLTMVVAMLARFFWVAVPLVRRRQLGVENQRLIATMICVVVTLGLYNFVESILFRPSDTLSGLVVLAVLATERWSRLSVPARVVEGLGAAPIVWRRGAALVWHR